MHMIVKPTVTTKFVSVSVLPCALGNTLEFLFEKDSKQDQQFSNTSNKSNKEFLSLNTLPPVFFFIPFHQVGVG